MPSKAEMGAWNDLQECGLGSTARGQESCTSEIFGVLNKMLLSFALLQAQASGRKKIKTTKTNKQKTMAFSPVLAERGLNLELTLPVWPQLRPATIQNIHRQQNWPRHWLQCLLKFQGYINSFQRFLTVNQQAPLQNMLNQNFFFFFNLIWNFWGCVLGS